MDNFSIQALIRKNRSYRRFDNSRKLSAEFLRGLIDSARISQSAANLQPLRYIPISSNDMADKLFTLLAWAGYLKEWGGPKPEERPVAYVVVLAESGRSQYYQVDAGLAMQNMMLTAAAEGVGSCVLGSVKRSETREILQIDAKYEILYVLAFGYPAEDVSLVDFKGKVEYYRDQEGRHYVPKRRLDSIIVKEF